MSSDRARKLFELATELPEEERVELARDLLRSVPGNFDGIELEDDELARRLDGVHDGSAPLISWSEARAAILRDE